MTSEVRASPITPLILLPAWVVLGAAASLAPHLVNLYDLPPALLSAFGTPASAWWYLPGIAAGELAIVQYIAISVLLGRVSPIALAWVPITIVAVIVSAPLGRLFHMAIPINAVTDAVTQHQTYRLDAALNHVGIGLLVGLGQGLILGLLFKRKWLVAVWGIGNAVAGFALGMVVQSEFGPMPIIRFDPVLVFYLTTVIGGGLYAAITGAILVTAVVRPTDTPKRQGAVRAELSPTPSA